MAIESKNYFPERNITMSEYEKVLARLRDEKNIDTILAELKKYRAKKTDELSANEYQEHKKIVRYLERKIAREDPERMIEADNKYLSGKFKDKFN